MPKKKTAARTAKAEVEVVPAVAPADAPEFPVAAEDVVDAVIRASTSPDLAKSVEAAMSQAVLDIQAESEAIAAETGDEEDKRLRILALNDPVAVRTRMLEYRLKVLNEAGGVGDVTDYNDAFSRCLVELDTVGVRKLWAIAQPGMPQPQTEHEALISLHIARTQAASLAMRLRAYSHRWLVDNGYPSRLPDELKTKAERMYPRVVGAVGLSINFRAPELKPAGVAIEKVMAEAVLNLYADGEQRPEIVTPVMNEAGAKERRKLFGRGD